MHTGQQQGLEANDRYKMLWDLYVFSFIKSWKIEKDQNVNMSIIKQVLGTTALFNSKFLTYLGEMHTDIELYC